MAQGFGKHLLKALGYGVFGVIFFGLTASAFARYFTALLEEMPELINIASGKEPRPLQLDRFAGAYSIVGEKQEKAADEKTLVLLGRFSGNPDIEKARAEFERAQKIEETFHKDFDGIDFTRRSIGGLIGV